MKRYAALFIILVAGLLVGWLAREPAGRYGFQVVVEPDAVVVFRLDTRTGRVESIGRARGQPPSLMVWLEGPE